MSTRQCEGCPTVFEVPATYRAKRFCSRACSNRATAEARAASTRAHEKYKPPVCPCGKAVPPPPGQQYVYASQKKYCSPECRVKYGKKKQRDPANYVTFECLNCGTEVTRYKKYGSGHSKYCSNACAQRHTRTKVHIVMEDSVVLDSTWEALFYGLCGYLKIPCDRYDREQGVEWAEGSWYAPDFVLPSLGMAVEIKGQEDDDDSDRWDLYRRERGLLVVLDYQSLEEIRRLDASAVLAFLSEVASEP